MSNLRRERFYCSECGHEIAGEFVEMLRRGEPVFCEACGSRITVKIQKTVGLPRAEKIQPKPACCPLAAPAPPRATSPPSREPGMDEILAAQRTEIAKNAQADSKGTREPEWRKAINSVKKYKLDLAIQRLNRISLIIGVLILTIAGPSSLIAAAGSIAFSWLLALVVCALGAIITDVRFFNVINQKDYSFRGIDLIVWGFIGCFGFGVGALILAKGICILIYTVHKDSGFPRLTRVQWFHVLISRLNANSIYVGFLIWGGTLTAAIYTIATRFAYEFIAFIILGFIVLLIDRFLFTPKLKMKLENRRSVELGLGMLASGIIGTLDFAMGVALLIKGLLVILLSGISETPPKPIEVPVPVQLPPQEQKTNEIPTVTPPKIEQPPVVVNAAPAIQGPVASTQKPPVPTRVPSPPILIPTPAEIKAFPPEKKPAVPPGKLEGVPSGSEDFEKQAVIKNYLNRVYTVLSSKIRDRVQKLNIPENEKREIIDGLLNLTPQEQEQFLAELEELARRLMPEIVGRILSLNLSKEQNEVLLHQMEYLSDQEQLEFVAELEKARAGST